jgi:hypothetical protein
MSTNDQPHESVDGDDVADEILIWGREITVGFAALDPAGLPPWTPRSTSVEHQPRWRTRGPGGSDPPPRHPR